MGWVGDKKWTPEVEIRRVSQRMSSIKLLMRAFQRETSPDAGLEIRAHGKVRADDEEKEYSSAVFGNATPSLCSGHLE